MNGIYRYRLEYQIPFCVSNKSNKVYHFSCKKFLCIHLIWVTNELYGVVIVLFWIISNVANVFTFRPHFDGCVCILVFFPLEIFAHRGICLSKLIDLSQHQSDVNLFSPSKIQLFYPIFIELCMW
jgi:hypothetical protein